MDVAEPASALNALPEVLAGNDAPEAVRITDVTLREAEQSGEDVWFSGEEKVRLGRALEAAGVAQIQVGYPGHFARDAEMTRLLADALDTARVEAVALVFVDEWEQEVDACVESGADVVLISCRGSRRHLDLLGWDDDEAITRVARSVERAAASGLQVTTAIGDTTRSEPDLLRRLWTAAAEAGAGRITIADSVGAASPELIAYLVRDALRVSGLPVNVHCHDDFGLAVANTVAGVRAGADVADGAVNGLGDRAGNAALEEVVAALTLVYGIDTGVALGELTALSQLFAEVAGVPLAAHKAVTGSAVFAHTLPTHVSAMRRDARALQPYEPELVGNVGRFGQRPEV